MMKLNIELPDKASDLLRLALDDLSKVSKWYGVEIYMSDWFFKHRGVCHVCLAGAVMLAHTENLEDVLGILPSYYSQAVAAKLRSLNTLRMGDINTGISFLMKGSSTEFLQELGIPDRVEVPSYTSNPDGWWVAMNALVTLLKDKGL